LPDVSFVGGGAEAAYWMQNSGVFELYGQHFPPIVLRSSCAWIDKSSQKKMAKLALSLEDLFLGYSQLERDILNKNGLEHFFKNEENAILQEFNSIITTIENVDSTLKPVAGAEQKKVLQSIEMLRGKMTKVLKAKNDQKLQQLKFVMDRFLPADLLQERSESILPLLCSNGLSLFSWMIDHLNPFENSFVVFEEEDDQI
jgi:uncharacterized protein YllA (UPF0747 family)